MKKNLMDNYFNKEYEVYELEYQDISEETIKEKISEVLQNDIRYDEIKGLSMNIKKKYNLYYLLESNDDSLNYSLSNLEHNVSSVINVSAIYVDPNLIKAKIYDKKFLYQLNNFSKVISLEEINSNYTICLFERDFSYISLSKATERICTKHRICQNEKGYRFDIDLYNVSYKRKWIILEPIYEIVIPYQTGKKTQEYKSIYSLTTNRFRTFSYPYNKGYLEYLKYNKSFLTKINSVLDEYYYKDCYYAHLESKKETSHYRLKQHVKSFFKDEDETLKTRYSKIGYFFFKNKKCLINACKKGEYFNFEEELYNLSLLSKVDSKANLKLAEMASMHLLGKVKKSKELEIKYLTEAAKLSDKEALKLLNIHYSKESYKDDSLANYYLKQLKEIS